MARSRCSISNAYHCSYSFHDYNYALGPRSHRDSTKFQDLKVPAGGCGKSQVVLKVELIKMTFKGKMLSNVSSRFVVVLCETVGPRSSLSGFLLSISS